MALLYEAKICIHMYIVENSFMSVTIVAKICIIYIYISWKTGLNSTCTFLCHPVESYIHGLMGGLIFYTFLPHSLTKRPQVNDFLGP